MTMTHSHTFQHSLIALFVLKHKNVIKLWYEGNLILFTLLREFVSLNTLIWLKINKWRQID